MVADRALVWHREPVEEERVTVSATARVMPPPAAADDLESHQSRLIVAAVIDALGDVPVILCGSRAIGTHRALSDHDLLVVLPWRRMLSAIPTLRGLSARLTDKLGVPVSLNPLPARILRSHVNLFLWKIAHEGRVLSSPPEFALPRVTRPPYDDHVRFSYLMSALQELLRGADGEIRRRDQAAYKALLMLAQLRLLERGQYSMTLENALARLEPQDREFLELDRQADRWTQACSKVLTELVCVSSPGPAAAMRVNARYAALALLRGRRRLRAAASLRAIDRRLADTAALLAGTLVERTAANPDAVSVVCESLPRSLRRLASPSWEGIRALLEQEWPDAHPLIGQ